LEATWQLAMLDMEEGAYGRAVVGFETVMGEDSTYANGLFFTARCYEAMGKTEAALIRYNEYLPYAPDTVVANRVQDFITRLEFGTPAGTNE
jgi:tetratricopeptide (TPR) repeat protein